MNFETAAFSFDGKYVTASGLDSTLKILSLETGKVEKTLTGFTSLVRSIAFSRDGKYVATGSDDNTVTVWSIETGYAETTFVWHQKAVWSVVFSPDGQYIAVDGNGEPRVFDIHQSIEDNTFLYPLHEMADAGLVIEPADTPQYISELLESVKEGKLSKKEAFDKAERAIKDASVLKKLRQDLQ